MLLLLFSPNNGQLEISGFILDVDFVLKLSLGSILLLTVYSLFSVFKAQIEFKKLNLDEYLLNCNAPGEMTNEEKSRLLGEMNYIISCINEKIAEGSENAWQWKIKLKSVHYTRSRVLKTTKVIPAELSSEDIARLKQNSSLLSLKDYNQNAGTDSSTISSINDKISLYRKHRQEQA